MPSSEKQIQAARIGGAQPLPDGRVVLVEYDPRWPELFEREAQRVRAVLGERVLGLEHCGSTSIPGLIAKPIVDMLLAVADSADESAYVPPMEQAGYVLHVREPDWFEHRLFKGPDTAVNLHVFSSARLRSSACCCSATTCGPTPSTATCTSRPSASSPSAVEVHPELRRRQGRHRGIHHRPRSSAGTLMPVYADPEDAAVWPRRPANVDGADRGGARGARRYRRRRGRDPGGG